jgi:SAM-dependent methyltransferase
LAHLRKQGGSILDVGGGASPYRGATHILDALEFSASRLSANAWGGDEGVVPSWTSKEYTRHDICSGVAWPFEDQRFDLGLSGHCLEDLRDPLPAVRELCRVSRTVLIICPSRLLEQTRGIDHPRFCGFPHHPWMVYVEDGKLIFQRKTPVLELRGCHLSCPFGMTLPRNLGAMCYLGGPIEPVERVFWSTEQEREDLAGFVREKRTQSTLFVRKPRMVNGRHGWRELVGRRIYAFRQRYLGAV